MYVVLRTEEACLGWVRDTSDPFFLLVVPLSVWRLFRHRGHKDMEVNFQHENFPIQRDNIKEVNRMISVVLIACDCQWLRKLQLTSFYVLRNASFFYWRIEVPGRVTGVLNT